MILIIAASPFQLFCINSYLIKNNITSKYKVIFYYDSESSQKQIQNSYFENLDIEIYERKLKKSGASSFRQHLYLLRDLYHTLIFNNKFDKIYVGDARLPLYNFLIRINTTCDVKIFDDGAATLELYDTLFKKKVYAPLYPNLQLTNVEIITIYKKILPNSDVIKENKLPKKSFNKSDFVVHYGSNFYESNCLSLFDEINFLSRVYKELKKTSKNIYYKPHRLECEKKIKKIINIGFILKDDTNIAELELINENFFPSLVSSSNSSVLLNLGLITDINTICYKFKKDLVLSCPKYEKLRSYWFFLEDKCKIKTLLL